MYDTTVTPYCRISWTNRSGLQAARQRDAGAADDRATQVDQQRGFVVQRRQAVHGVFAVQGRRRSGSEGRHRPAVVGDLLGDQLAAGRGERDGRQVPRQARVGPIPGGQLDGVGVDLLHVDDLSCASARRQVQSRATHRRPAPAPGPAIGRAASRLVGSVRISVTPPEPDRRGQIGVRPHHHGNRAQPGQRGDRHQRTGSGLHQHAHPVALAHPDLDQATNDVVDAPVHGLVGVHAPVEQQEFALRGVVCLFVDDAAQRDPGVIVDLSQPGQPRQRPGRLHGQGPHRFVGRDDRVGRAASQRHRRLGDLAQAVYEPGAECDTAVGVFGGLIGHQVDVRRLVATGGQPAHPFGDGRPALLCRPGSHDQTEMPCPDQAFVDLGVGRRPPDAAHRRRLADVVDLADERQYRAGDIGERHHLPVDGETAGHHPVVGDELLEQFRDRRARPGDPPFATRGTCAAVRGAAVPHGRAAGARSRPGPWRS